MKRTQKKPAVETLPPSELQMAKLITVDFVDAYDQRTRRAQQFAALLADILDPVGGLVRTDHGYSLSELARTISDELDTAIEESTRRWQQAPDATEGGA